MAYQETADLGCDKTFALGGTREDKKTGKKYKNPTFVEGFYVGTKKGIDTGNDKPSNLHIFVGEVRTEEGGKVLFTGRVGIWGKTDLDRKAEQWKVGLMTKAFFKGMQEKSEVKRGRKPMYLYKSFQDPESIDETLVGAAEGEEIYEADTEGSAPVDAEGIAEESAGDEEEAYEEEASLDAEEEAVDEAPATPAKKPAKAATPAADRQAAMQKLMGGKSSTKTA